MDKFECQNKNLENYLHPSSPDLIPMYTLEPLQNIRITSLEHEISSKLPSNLQLNYWSSARGAIKFLLKNYEQAKETISISTTTQSPYLSGCLTEVTSKRIIRDKGINDKWDIFVADFGYENKKYSTDAIIYDDAWSFSIDVANSFILNGGKHYISSLPKIVGLGMGAVVISEKPSKLFPENQNNESATIMSKVTNDFIGTYQEVVNVRSRNLEKLTANLSKGFVFGMGEFTSKFPGTGIFESKYKFDEVRFKKMLQLHGIRGTSFFGNQKIILPIHQLLTESDLDYISEITLHCIELCY